MQAPNLTLRTGSLGELLAPLTSRGSSQLPSVPRVLAEAMLTQPEKQSLPFVSIKKSCKIYKPCRITTEKSFIQKESKSFSLQM